MLSFDHSGHVGGESSTAKAFVTVVCDILASTLVKATTVWSPFTAVNIACLAAPGMRGLILVWSTDIKEFLKQVG
jgi:hypothetical protein